MHCYHRRACRESSGPVCLNHPLDTGKFIRSHGGSLIYVIIAPVCRLYDREELPWPSCSLAWKGKQPSWNRVGARFVPDMAAARCPSYVVEGRDLHGNCWIDVLTFYWDRLDGKTKEWWYYKGPKSKPFPLGPWEDRSNQDFGQESLENKV